MMGVPRVGAIVWIENYRPKAAQTGGLGPPSHQQNEGNEHEHDSAESAEQVEVVPWAIGQAPAHAGEELVVLGDMDEHHDQQAEAAPEGEKTSHCGDLDYMSDFDKRGVLRRIIHRAN